MATEDAVNPLLVHMPAVIPEQGCDPPVAVSPEPLGKGDDRRCHGVFIVAPDVRLALGPPRLFQAGRDTAPIQRSVGTQVLP